MIQLNPAGVFWQDGKPRPEAGDSREAGREKTISYPILKAHNTSAGMSRLELKFDSLISHDITYVGIIQTAAASGLERFPLPYVLTNCHNSLCAVGGTINEDDHVFGLSAAVKYGGIYVPANLCVIHQYAREMMASCGKMILGSDSHTRYGPLGTMGIGEGGPEIVKQLLGETYDTTVPEVVLVYLTGSPSRGVGPHDVAVALCGAVYKNSFVKNKILEFAGPGVKALPIDYRFGIDVMTTETACLSSVWETDEKVREWLAAHGREDEYRKTEPKNGAYYDCMITIDLSKIEPMAALPFHPSEAYTLAELIKNPGDILREAEKRAYEQSEGIAEIELTNKITNGRLQTDQGIIAGCAGGMFDNIEEAAAVLNGHDTGSGYFSLSVYPSGVPVLNELIKSGAMQKLTAAGAVFKPCFCGPCFGAGDVPSNNALSLRHTTRNFPNREGSKPADGQIAAVMLADARSIAASARNRGILTSAAEIEYKTPERRPYAFDKEIYDKRVYDGFGKADPKASLRFGPNITLWPDIPDLPENLLLELACVIHDPVTTTDELIPSGDASSYRSNPRKLASFTLSRKDPEYVGRAERIQTEEKERSAGIVSEKLRSIYDLPELSGEDIKSARLGSCIFAEKPGDGSAREQAASCQRILGGCANICFEYATKRYRSNCINWGILPFTTARENGFDHLPGDHIYIPGIRSAVLSGAAEIPAKTISGGAVRDIVFYLPELTEEERRILAAGCLMNYYAARRRK
ncbi:MAG: hydratase [Oscillospiraceae bacterium]|nr:hydratase [Oscillospiraceae bacterium]